MISARRQLFRLVLGLGLLAQATLVFSQAAETLPRQVALTGAINFRDLGGYATADGRRVKFGKVFRSDNLSHLSGDDWQQLRQRGVTVVVDFRSREELAALPPGVPGDITTLELPMGLAGVDIEQLRQRISSGDLAGLPQPGAYSEIALTQTGPLKQWFGLLLENRPGASVFHCTSGKDRTGLAAVLLLLALGVPEATALDDYEASNGFLAPAIEKTLVRVRARPNFQGSTDTLAALLGVRRAQMTDTLAALRKKYGSVEGYLELALGVDEARRRALKAALLD